MADTIRETPVSTNDEALKFPQSTLEEPNHHNSKDLARQAAYYLTGLEGVVPILLEAAKMAAALHRVRHGATVSLSHGDMLGLPFYSVSLHPERTVEMTSQPCWEHLFAFAVINADLLFLPSYGIGTWLDSDRGLHVLDLVVCVSSVSEALYLGVLHGQRAIFDLGSAREIPVASVTISHFNGEES